jgi:hypothetical protein
VQHLSKVFAIESTQSQIEEKEKEEEEGGGGGGRREEKRKEEIETLLTFEQPCLTLIALVDYIIIIRLDTMSSEVFFEMFGIEMDAHLRHLERIESGKADKIKARIKPSKRKGRFFVPFEIASKKIAKTGTLKK